MTSRSLLAGVMMTGLLMSSSRLAAAESTPLAKVPANLDEIKAMQKKVQEVTKKVMPAVVGVQLGSIQGSGVIVSEDGYVLTAGHVSGKPGQNVTLILPNGKHLKGKTLGHNQLIDSGMIKITDEGKWPFVSIGESTKLTQGEWVISLGHPGGFNSQRSPPLRLGRILLFDLDGKVIGIHSRIGVSVTQNIHVPIDTYTDTWDGLAASETSFSKKAIKLGLSFEKIGERMKIIGVEKDSPEEKAGFKLKDYFAKLDGKEITTQDDIDKILKGKRPGQELAVEVVRGAERLTLKLVLPKP